MTGPTVVRGWVTGNDASIRAAQRGAVAGLQNGSAATVEPAQSTIPTTQVSPALRWTEFPSLKASRKVEDSGSWLHFIERLGKAGPFAAKSDAPLLKLATFGSTSTPKGSLRHDGNVLSIHGIEGDYDAELVPMQDALSRLERAGIRAAIYPTASCAPAKPRWRVLAPLSKPMPPAEHERLVARLNGALGGILSRESFILSQSYYFGAVAGSAQRYEVLTTFGDASDGTCIDDLDKLDQIAIGKSSNAEHLQKSAQTDPRKAPDLQKSTEANLSHLLSPSVVFCRSYEFPPGSIPTEPGQRIRCLFLLARHLKRDRPSATPSELSEIAARWHQLALPFIRTKELDVTRADLQSAFEKVKQPHGAVMEEVLRNIDDTPLPPGVESLKYGDACNRLVRICAALQAAQEGSNPFFLGGRKAGDLIGVHFTDASKLLKMLVGDGVIELVKLGKGNSASRYRFIWPAGKPRT